MTRIQYVFSALGTAFLAFILTSCATSAEAHKHTHRHPINHSLPPTFDVDFLPHTENKPFGSYLAMNLPFENFAPLRLELEHRLQKKLKHRGEAHITVITPPEFEKSLQDKISIEEINKMAQDLDLQKSSLKYICIGKAQLKIKEQMEQAYFVVVNAPELLLIRKKIKELFLQRGGSEKSFQETLFFPHITLGFTTRDLHFEEGAIKDSSSCLYHLKGQP